MGKGTLWLLVLVAGGYFTAVIIGNTLSFLEQAWLAEVFVGNSEAAPNARLAYSLFVLTGRDVAPWVNAYTLQPWKVFTSWMVESTLFSMVMALVGVYFVGRVMEEFLGWRKLFAAVAGLSTVSALLAAIVDPLIMPHRLSVIMGMHAALLGLLTPLYWLYPRDQMIFSFRARSFIAFLIGALALLRFATAFATSEPVTHSPTQSIFAVAVSALVMIWLKRRGRLPSAVGESDDRAAWGRPMYRPEEGRGSFFDAPQADPEDEERRLEREAKAQLDALLDKISKSGLESLTRAERRFLDEQSQKRKR